MDNQPSYLCVEESLLKSRTSTYTLKYRLVLTQPLGTSSLARRVAPLWPISAYLFTTVLYHIDPFGVDNKASPVQKIPPQGTKLATQQCVMWGLGPMKRAAEHCCICVTGHACVERFVTPPPKNNLVALVLGDLISNC